MPEKRSQKGVCTVEKTLVILIKLLMLMARLVIFPFKLGGALLFLLSSLCMAALSKESAEDLLSAWKNPDLWYWIRP